MVDYMSLSTLEALASGVLDRPDIATNAQEGLTWKEIDEDDCGIDTIRSVLNSGCGAEASMYYGCWDVWPTAAGFSGLLRQYRRITDQFDDLPIDEAANRAEEWVTVCRG